MDLQTQLLKGNSKAQAEKIAAFIGSHPARFEELVNLFLAGPYRVTQRAAWPLSICVERNPELVAPHLSSLLRHLSKPGIHDAVKRNTVRLLQHIHIPKRSHGQIADLCFQYLNDKREAIAVRVFSMTVLERIASESPALQRELRIIIEDHLPFASPAYLSRARKILKRLPKP